MNNLEIFKTPDGKPLEMGREQLKNECLKSLKFWKPFLNKKGWENAAKEHISFWNFLLKQTNNQKSIKTMKNQGLKKPTVRGLKTVCSQVIKATGLKVDGTLKKGYKYVAGGKIVKTSATPCKAKKVCAKKMVAKKKPVAKKKTTTRKTTAKTKK
ncbi:hypothetical protein [Flavobacterium praedii]|uniref:hypothetical protein n=1 Tax=Flavobacterium praedii TaxID=3002900 RepID=UPI002481E84C|nr:hypothetical protein [Flavobacterium praedii]